MNSLNNFTDWHLLADTFCFRKITQEENKTYIIVAEFFIKYNYDNSIAGMDSTDIIERTDNIEIVELDHADRENILKTNSYIQYLEDQTQSIVVKYDFIEKVFDTRNNLIIIANKNKYNYCEEMEIIELLE